MQVDLEFVISSSGAVNISKLLVRDALALSSGSANFFTQIETLIKNINKELEPLKNTTLPASAIPVGAEADFQPVVFGVRLK